MPGGGARKCRSGFSAPACSARSSPPMLGLPYAFASHFAPEALMPALEIYREEFRRPTQLDRPYAMVGCNVVAADTDAEARRLFTSLQQASSTCCAERRGQLPPPIDDIESLLDADRKGAGVAHARRSFVGSAERSARLEAFIAETGADELMVAAAIYDQQARLRSYELLAQAMS